MADEDTLGTDQDVLADQELPEETSVEDATESLDSEEQETGEDDAQAAGDDEGEEGRPKKKGGFQRKIEKLEREKFDREIEAEQWRRQYESLQQQLQEQRPQMPQGQPQGAPMPRLADFDYDENRHAEAVAQWHQSQVQALWRQQQEAAQRQAQEQAAQQQHMAMQAKLAEATAKYPDFIARVQNPELPNLTTVNPVAFQAVINSPQFADVAMHLANNPSEIYAFRGLDPVSTIRKVAELELSLKAKPAAKPTPPPPPPSKVQGKGPAVKPIEKMSMAEYVEYRRQQRSG